MKSKNSKIFKLAKYISDFPGSNRKQINLSVFKNTKPGHHNSTYRTLISRGVIEHEKDSNIRANGYYITDLGHSIMNSMPRHPDKFIEEASIHRNKKLIKELSLDKIKDLKKLSFKKLSKVDIYHIGIDMTLISEFVKLDLLAFDGELYFSNNTISK